MGYKFRVGDVVKLKADVYCASYFRSAHGYGRVVSVSAVPWPYHVAKGKRGKGMTWLFTARELDLIERPKPKTKGA